MNRLLAAIILSLSMFSCIDVITPEPLEIDNIVFAQEGAIEDVLIFKTLELTNDRAMLTWEVDSTNLSAGNFEVISGIRITYEYPLRPPMNVPFSDGAMTHPIRTNDSTHCFSAYAFTGDFRNSLRIQSSICESN